MCIAVCGKVVELYGDMARVDVMGNICRVNVRFVRARPGDHVLIHAGSAIEIVRKETSDEIIAIFEELAELSGDGFDAR